MRIIIIIIIWMYYTILLLLFGCTIPYHWIYYTHMYYTYAH